MSNNSDAEHFWNSASVFPEPPTTAARTRKNSTEAEICIPDTDQHFAPSCTTGALLSMRESAATEQALPRSVADDVDNVVGVVSFTAGEHDSAAHHKDCHMAETKEKKTKAAYIREEIAAARSKSADKIRPKDIIARLASRGIAVTAPQVSVAVRDFEAGESQPAKKSPDLAKAAAKVAAAVASVRGKPAKTGATATTTRRRAAHKVSLPDMPSEAPSAASPTTGIAGRTALIEEFVAKVGGVTAARKLLDGYEAFVTAAS